MNRFLNKLIKEVKSHLFIHIILFAILLAAFLIRVYRINELLGFYYDQGRDALVIWDLIHKGKLFLIGPVTGIEGIFRGPFYYYLIAPFYLLGKGNPVYPSVFLSLTSVVAAAVLFFLGKKTNGTATGIFAALLAAFSYQIFYASRWLSNPTPMLLLSVIFIWALLKVWQGKNNWLPITVFIAGLSLFHFGSAGELYYFLAILAVLIWKVFLAKGLDFNKKAFPSKNIIFITCTTFIIVILPQLVFDFRHDWILSKNFQKTFLAGESFALPTKQFMKNKIIFFRDVFTYKIFPQRSPTRAFFLISSIFLFLYYFRELIKIDAVKISLILLFSPMLGLVYFKGNYGNIYDYYLTGYYLPFVFLYALFLGFIWKKGYLGKVFVLCFLALFFISNLPVIKNTLADDGSDNRSVIFANQKKVVDWVFNNAGGAIFNVDVYVPPVISYAYDYLFLWQGTEKCGKNLCGLVKDKQVESLYTLYEVDLPHPERLESWLSRQKTIGVVEKEEKFGGITVQKRHRIR